MNPYNDHTKHLMLMVTYDCNLRCSYCYENHKQNKKITIEQALSYIKKGFYDALSNPWNERLEITFMGGEPLLEWQTIKKIVETIEDVNDWPLPYHFFAATNGTLLNNEMKSWFSKRRDNFILGISVDGDCEMQDTNRNNSSSYIDLDFFLETWPKQSNKMTISHNTLPNLASGIVYLHNKGFKNVEANLAMGQCWEQSDLSLYAQQLDILIEYYLNNPQIKRCSLLDIDLLTALNLSGEKRKYCGCGSATVFVDVDGTEYPCHLFAPISMTNSQLKKAKLINFDDHPLFINEKCGDCLLHDVCPRCYGISFKQTGDLKYQQPFLCKAFKIQFLSNCKMSELLLIRNPKMKNAQKVKAVLSFVNKYFI